jgi:hypothetical protein
MIDAIALLLKNDENFSSSFVRFKAPENGGGNF